MANTTRLLAPLIVACILTTPATVRAYEHDQLSVPELTGLYVEGEPALEATVDFGIDFEFGPQIVVEVTASGTRGTFVGGSYSAYVLVSVLKPEGQVVISPRLLGPYDATPRTSDTSLITADGGIDQPEVGTSSSIYNIVIEFYGHTLLGDIVEPATIDILDVTIHATDAPPSDGCGPDTNCDGFVGIEDLNIVLGTWNNGRLPVPPPSPAIPEPGTLLAFAAGLGLASRRCRR